MCKDQLGMKRVVSNRYFEFACHANPSIIYFPRSTIEFETKTKENI